MVASAGSRSFCLPATSLIELRKHADQPAANSCSGLVPLPGVPGDESLMDRRPSSLWEAPSRPPVVWVFAVYSTLSNGIVGSFLRQRSVVLRSAGRCETMRLSESFQGSLNARRRPRPPWQTRAAPLEASCVRCRPLCRGGYTCRRTSWHRNSDGGVARHWHRL